MEIKNYYLTELEVEYKFNNFILKYNILDITTLLDDYRQVPPRTN